MRGLHFIPPKLKFKRYQKMLIKGIIQSTHPTKLYHGFCGLKSLQYGFITPKQFEIARRLLRRFIGKRRKKKKIKIWRRVYQTRPITSKSRGVRMGQGKGNIKYWVLPVYPATIIVEIGKRVKKKRSVSIALNKTRKFYGLSTKLICKKKNFKKYGILAHYFSRNCFLYEKYIWLYHN
jgi:large subunit ribosomal protein L16